MAFPWNLFPKIAHTEAGWQISASIGGTRLSMEGKWAASLSRPDVAIANARRSSASVTSPASEPAKASWTLAGSMIEATTVAHLKSKTAAGKCKSFVADFMQPIFRLKEFAPLDADVRADRVMHALPEDMFR